MGSVITMSQKIKIFEVGPRDGLQNELIILDPKIKIEFINRLSKTGLKNIEVGALVSPKWVPQMQGSDQVFKKVSKGSKGINYSLLVPNLKGLDLAIQCKAKEVAIFTAASEKFCKKNINCTIKESFERFEPVMKLAKQKKIRVRGYLSTVFECPFQGPISPDTVATLAKRLFEIGCYEVSLGDTIGVGTPNNVEALFKALKKKKLPIDKIAMHFHNTRGTALANVLKSLELGFRIFDSSVGGLGGCPYAPGALGNLATEDLVYFTERMGFKTGVDLKKIIQVHHWIQSTIGRPLASHLGRSGL
jgi:hydroxymethylglutaryl-CoA lyase